MMLGLETLGSDIHLDVNLTYTTHLNIVADQAHPPVATASQIGPPLARRCSHHTTRFCVFILTVNMALCPLELIFSTSHFTFDLVVYSSPNRSMGV